MHEKFLKIFRTLSLLGKSSPRWTTVNIGLALLSGIIPLLIIYFTKIIIDKVSTSHSSEAIIIVIAFGALLLINEICNILHTLSKELITQKITDYVYNILHKQSATLDISYFEDPKYHDIFHRARSEAVFRPARIANNTFRLIQNSIALFSILFIIINFHWIIAGIILLSAIPILIIRIRFSDILYNWKIEKTNTERKVRYYHWLLTSEKFIKEIRIFNIGNLFIKNFKESKETLNKERAEINFKRSIIEIIAQLFAVIVITGTFVFIVSQTISGRFSIGEMVLFFFIFQRGFSSIREILSCLSGLYEDNLFISDLMKFIGLKSNIHNQSKQENHITKDTAHLTFKNVSFRYNFQNKETLNNINFSANKGEVIAILGENGAGKSTLLKLICRLYDASNGSITFNGEDIKSIALTDWQKKISVLFQDFSQYNFTLSENIEFGNTDKHASVDELKKICEMAGLKSLQERLPDGFNNTLGTTFDKSYEPSFGEWQKIALARALFKDSEILLLDEPTSGMDLKTEIEFIENLKHITKNKITFIITHKISTIKNADKIIVLSNGEIIESGSHNELLSLKGEYAMLNEMQRQLSK